MSEYIRFDSNTIRAFETAIERHHRVDVWKVLHATLKRADGYSLNEAEKALYDILTKNLAYELNGWEKSEEPPKP